MSLDETTRRSALARRLADEHAKLAVIQRQASEEVERWAADPADTERLRELGDCLCGFREHLTRHFQLEEAQGFIGGDGNLSTEREVQRLLADHRRFERRIEELIGRVERVSDRSMPLPEALARDLRDLLSDLASHERRETHLIQSIAYRETGGGD